MILTAHLRGASLLATAGLLITDPQTLGLWSVVITSVAGLVSQILRARAEERRNEQRHQWEVSAKNRILRDIAENTDLTKGAAVKAAAALDTANHVNEKISDAIGAIRSSQLERIDPKRARK